MLLDELFVDVDDAVLSELFLVVKNITTPMITTSTIMNGITFFILRTPLLLHIKYKTSGLKVNNVCRSKIIINVGQR